MLRDDPAAEAGKPAPLKVNLVVLRFRGISPREHLIEQYRRQYVYIFATGGTAPVSSARPVVGRSRGAEKMKRHHPKP